MRNSSTSEMGPIPYATPIPAEAVAKPKRNWPMIALMVVFLGPVVLMAGIVFLLAFIAAVGSSADTNQASIERSATSLSGEVLSPTVGSFDQRPIATENSPAQL